MSTKFTTAFSLVAGFIGGIAPHYCVSATVYAQTATSLPQEVRAHKFVLVDEEGKARGAFGFETTGIPTIELMDREGSVWGYTLHAQRIKHGMLPELP